MLRMIGGKGKKKDGSIVSLLVHETRLRMYSDAEADAAVERWMRGTADENDRRIVVDALIAAEAKVRAGAVVLERDSDGPQEGAEGQ